MNCRKCETKLSAYVDKELEPLAAQEVSSHLASCAGCRAGEAAIRGLISVLAGLPRCEMSEAEQRRLMEGLRREIRQIPAAERQVRARLFPRLATAAAILVTVVVVSVALMTTPTSHKSSEPGNAPVAEAVSDEGQPTDPGTEIVVNGNATPVRTGQAGSSAMVGINPATASLLPMPRLVKSSNDYSKSEITEYSKDLGTRLDFYSDIWYQPAAGAARTLSGPDQSAMQANYHSSLCSLALDSGEDPESLTKSLSIASAQVPPGRFAIPCFVERASYQGQPVWIISYSVPEDARLFTNPEVASLVNLAKQMSSSGNLQGSALMEVLATTITPGAYASVSTATRSTVGTAGLELETLISGLAENNLVSYLRQLSELDSDELIRLISLETGYPFQISSGLLDMLTQRVWVVNPESGQVLFRPSR